MWHSRLGCDRRSAGGLNGHIVDASGAVKSQKFLPICLRSEVAAGFPLEARAADPYHRIMRTLLAILLLLALTAPACAADADHLVPADPQWTSSLTLTLVWILVAAAIIGPLARHFPKPSAGGQLFAEDRMER